VIHPSPHALAETPGDVLTRAPAALRHIRPNPRAQTRLAPSEHTLLFLRVTHGTIRLVERDEGELSSPKEGSPWGISSLNLHVTHNSPGTANAQQALRRLDRLCDPAGRQPLTSPTINSPHGCSHGLLSAVPAVSAREALCDPEERFQERLVMAPPSPGGRGYKQMRECAQFHRVSDRRQHRAQPGRIYWCRRSGRAQRLGIGG